MMRVFALCCAAAVLFAVTAAAAEPGTVVISGASICRDDPANPWCQGKSMPAGTRRSVAVDYQALQRAEALSERSPWMRGDVPWCEAFPGSAHCANRLMARR